MYDFIRNNLTFRGFLYFFSLVAGWPCVFYLMGWLPHYTINYVLLFAVSVFYVLLRKCEQLDRTIENILFIQILGWFFFSLIHFDSSYFTRILILLITFAMLRIQQSDDDSLRFCKLYNVWLIFQVVSGTIGLLLVLSGILHPIFQFDEMDGRPGYFFGFFATNTYLGGLVRNAGFYDEPGALAFWGMYALIFNKLFINGKKTELILIIGLISTMSIAYIIQLIAYLLVFYRKQSWKLILIILLVFLSLKIITSYNKSMDQAIWGRIQYNKTTGTIEGDNRTELMKKCWTIFCEHPIIGMGARELTSPSVRSKYGFVGANFFHNWAADGIIGTIIAYLPLLYLFLLGRYDKKMYGVGLILLLGYLQRPYDNTQILYPLMTYTLISKAQNLIFYKNEEQYIHNKLGNHGIAK